MNARFTTLAFAILTLGTANAQMQDNRDKHMTCENGGYNGDRSRYCEIREQSFPGAGRIVVDAGRNGGTTIKGWLRNDVLVRARVEAQADSDAEARSITGQVRVDTAGGQIAATGPEHSENSSWSVSYEIFVPQTTDLNLKTHNGGISVSDVRGRMEFS